jgi:uncharacterized membrane protein YcfT
MNATPAPGRELLPAATLRIVKPDPQRETLNGLPHDALPEPGSRLPVRVDWVDHAKAWSIVLVVMMHSTLGVGNAAGATGWLHSFVAFAKPFRMPDFFMVAGLFAAAAVDAPWLKFLDRKVIHFAYFYLLWLLIELAVKAPGLGIASPPAFAAEYAWHLIQPFSSMWFIQILPLLYLATRLVRHAPVAVVLSAAVTLHFVAAAVPGTGHYAMESDLTESVTVNSFLLFWIYFLIGHYGRGGLFSLADGSASSPLLSVAALAAWTVLEATATNRGWPDVFGFDLAFGILGACAVVVAAGLVTRLPGTGWLAYLGRNSLAIYLGFFLPMAAARFLVLRTFPGANVSLLAVAVTFAGVVGPVVMLRASSAAGMTFLFQRPYWARVDKSGLNRTRTEPT